MVTEALAKLKYEVLLDGEVVVFTADGLPDFDALQKYNGVRSPISYGIFDMLWLQGRNLMEVPLSDWKIILAWLLKKSPVLLLSESYPDGVALYQQLVERNLEGVVAKRMERPINRACREITG